MIIIILYLLCAGILIGTDDGKPWVLKDYVALVFAWIVAPVGVGMWIGRMMTASGFFEKDNNDK